MIVALLGAGTSRPGTEGVPPAVGVQRGRHFRILVLAGGPSHLAVLVAGETPAVPVAGETPAVPVVPGKQFKAFIQI